VSDAGLRPSWLFVGYRASPADGSGGPSVPPRPYRDRLDEVFLLDPAARDDRRPERPVCKALRYRRRDGEPPGGVAVRVRNHLLRAYPGAWDNDPTDADRRPAVVFVGFAPLRFVRLLATECSLPGSGRPCPLGLWGPAAARACWDVGAAVAAEGLSWADVLAFRRPADPADQAVWDGLTRAWPGPGRDPEQDVRLAVVLAAQLGLFGAPA